MSNKRGQMVLSAFLHPAGYDSRSWRLPGSRSEELGTLAPLRYIARRYEDAKLDAIFMADTIWAGPLLEGEVKMSPPYEPLTALSALAAVTDKIGLIGTFSTTFNHPYNLARRLAALDMLSNGRVGWNIVTTARGEDYYGTQPMSKEDRYRRAREFTHVVTGLWSAWSDDAVINDRATGRWADPSLITTFEHEGEFLKVSGFTNQRRSPQGHPVLIQAGQSSSGLDFGADVADVVYTAQPQREASIQYYAEYKARLAARGRNPDHTKILPGLVPYIGRTEAEARDIQESMSEFLDYEKLRTHIQGVYDLKLDDIGLDERVPAERFEGKNDDTAGTRFMAFRYLAVEEGYNLRDTLTIFRTIGGHSYIAGTASQIADRMVDWYEARACDGFSLNAPLFPSSVDAICDLLIPELQERGYARTEYTASTLRGHLGLPFPDAWDRRREAAE